MPRAPTAGREGAGSPRRSGGPPPPPCAGHCRTGTPRDPCRGRPGAGRARNPSNGGGDRPGRNLEPACGRGLEGQAVTVVSRRSIGMRVGSGPCPSLRRSQGRGHGAAGQQSRISTPPCAGSATAPPLAARSGGDSAVGRDREMALAWHTRRRQRGKCMQRRLPLSLDYASHPMAPFFWRPLAPSHRAIRFGGWPGQTPCPSLPDPYAAGIADQRRLGEEVAQRCRPTTLPLGTARRCAP